MKPDISIIMPVLNGQRYIREAIESILAQTIQIYELIVVDDGSTDETGAILKDFESRMIITVIHHETREGIARSINDGIRHASGRYIAFLDHDDAWFPEFLATQFGYLQAHPDVAMVHSDFQTIDAGGNVLEASVAVCRNRTRYSGNVFPQLFMDSFIVGNSVMIRTTCFEELGLIDEELRWGDYHMWLRIARHYKVAYVPKVLTKYRQHSAQTTQDVWHANPDLDSAGLMVIDKLLIAYPEIRSELGERAVQRRKASLYFDMAYAWFLKGASGNTRACLRKAIAAWPTNSRYYLLFIGSVVGPSRARTARQFLRRLRLPSFSGKAAATSDAVSNLTNR